MKEFSIGYAIGWVFTKIIGGIFKGIIYIFKGIFKLIKSFVSGVKEETQAASSECNEDGYIDEFKAEFIEKYKELEQKGVKIDWYEVEHTMTSEYPYPCATEKEKEIMDNGMSPLKHGYIPAVVDAFSFLNYGNYEGDNIDYTNRLVYPDEEKIAYWKNYLIEKAQSGDRWSQAALVVAENGKYYSDFWCSKEENAQWKQQYEKALFEDSRAGDPATMLAVASFGLDGTNDDIEKRQAYYKTAADAGFADAYVLLAKDLEMQYYRETGNVYVWGDENSCAYYKMIEKAAMLDNGITCGWCRKQIGDLYIDGECGYEKNLGAAKRFYESALQFGYKEAQSGLDTIEWIKKNPEYYAKYQR